MHIKLLFALCFVANFEHLSAQGCLYTQNCPAATDTMQICSFTDNNGDYWNDLLFNDQLTGGDNLLEEEGDLFVKAGFTPNCQGALDVRFQLFLDLDGDNIQETVINSWNLPEPGTVSFGNNTTTGIGTPVFWDKRAVTTEEKYQFAIQLTVTSNPSGLDSLVATLKRNTGATPNTYLKPFLPAGRHKIKWIITKGVGTVECVQNFRVKDCKAPTVVCVPGVTANLISSVPPSLTLWATDFLQYAQDNTTGSANITLSIRKSGTGTGFPGSPSITYNCDELGTQAIEIWAMDAYGNADYCETYVIITDNLGLCPATPQAQVSWCVRNWCDNALVSGVDTAYISNGLDPVLRITDPTTCSDTYSVNNTGQLSVSLVKNDDMLNGVTVLDVWKIIGHILGISPLSFPCGVLAADVNGSGSVTTFDAVNILRLITGVPSNGITRPSWILLDSASVVAAANGNPAALTTIWNAPNPVGSHHASFTAVKTADLDCDALPGFNTPVVDDRTVAYLHLPDVTLQAGQVLEVPLTFTNANEWIAFQLGLRFDPAVLSVEGYSSSLDDSSFGLINANTPGEFNLAWLNSSAVNYPAGAELARIQFKANSTVVLKNAVTLFMPTAGPVNGPEPLGYNANQEDVQLVLDLTTGTNTAVNHLLAANVAPNPVGAQGTDIRVTSPVAQSATLQLFDVTGRLCQTIRTELNTGTQQIHLSAESFTSGAGVYLWKISTEEGETTGKVVKM